MSATRIGRREDLRLLTGRGRFTADWDLPGQAHAAFLRADRAHARILGIDTAAARAHAGRRQRPDRRRRSCQRLQEPDSQEPGPRRRATDAAADATTGVGARQGALRRRAGGAGRCRDRSDRARGGRVDRRRLRGLAGTRQRRRRRRCDDDNAARAHPRQRRIRVRDGPAPAGRCRPRQRRPCRPVAPEGPAAFRYADGAEGLPCQLRRRQRQLGRLHADPGHGRSAGLVRACDRPDARSLSHSRPRCRRRVRRSQRGLSRACGHRLGHEARRPPGQMDRNALRDDGQRSPRARHRHGRHARARQGRSISRLPGRMARRYRRLLLERRPTDHDGCNAARHGEQCLCRARRPLPASPGADQPAADRSLSRRRTPERRLHVGAARRRGRTRHRHRSCRASSS